MFTILFTIAMFAAFAWVIWFAITDEALQDQDPNYREYYYDTRKGYEGWKRVGDP